MLQEPIQNGRIAIYVESFQIDLPGGLVGNFARHTRASIRVERTPRATDSRMEGRSLDPLLTTQRWS